MQVFIVGTPYETAEALDKRRLNKQIIECGQILDAISGETKAWIKHPCVKMYFNYAKWIEWYTSCLAYYKNGYKHIAKECSDFADKLRPDFHTHDYFNQMKRRLYTKSNNHYSQWAELGESDCNWYWSDDENKFLKYINGKRIE